MLTAVLLWSGILLLLYGFYKWATLNNDYFEKRGVSYMKPTFLFGNNGGFLLQRYSIAEITQIFYTANPGYKLVGAFDFRKPILMLRDPETIKQVVVKDFDHFEDHQNFIDDKIDVLFGNSLFLMKGSKWRDMRATLSPAFTGSKMRLMFELVSECGAEMVKTLLKQVEADGVVDFEAKELFSKYTNDVISSAAFGYKINSFENPDNKFFVNGKRLMNFTSLMSFVKIILIATVPKLASFLKISFIDATASIFFRSMVLDNMASREKQGIFRPDMINILMNVRKGNSIKNAMDTKDKETDGFATVEESTIGNREVQRVWNDDEIVAQCFIFFLAGFDTSSTLLSFIAYELSVNTDIQQKLYEEVKETYNSLGGKKLTYDAVQKLKYMDMVVSETLRYWPPLAAIDRVCVKDYNYDDGQCKFKIEKDTVVNIPIYGLHFDEKYWENPTKFDPERFGDGSKDKITPGTYLPFGVGPRNCIGSRFALMEAKAIIYYLLLKFKFEPNSKSQIPAKLKKGSIGMVAEKGLHVSLRLRE